MRIMPGSSITISVNVPEYLMIGRKADIKVSGWNVAEELITVGN